MCKLTLNTLSSFPLFFHTIVILFLYMNKSNTHTQQINNPYQIKYVTPVITLNQRREKDFDGKRVIQRSSSYSYQIILNYQ